MGRGKVSIMTSPDQPLGSSHPHLGGLIKAVHSFATGPAYWFRQNVVEPLRGEAPAWYHRRFQRVPGIETCYMDDVVCREEAHWQFMRDKMVDQEIVKILRDRMNDCFFYEKGTGLVHMQTFPEPIIDVGEGSKHICKNLFDTYNRAASLLLTRPIS